MPVARQSSASADVLVIGGGIMGLWAAVFARRAGLTVHVVEQTALASGASGGLLGALMPHMPDRWSDKKQLQLDALVSLEDEIARIEEETGLSAGYRRCGRLIPLPKPHLRDIALGHEADAHRVWHAGSRSFSWSVRDADFAAGLIDPAAAEAGLVEDTLAARVNPRGLMAALAARLKADPGASISEGAEVVALYARTGDAVLADGTWLRFGHAVIAAGVQSAGLLAALSGPLKKPAVVPVKGQAALLRADLQESAPVIYRDGLYVVPHEGGVVAIGSTSEVRFDAPFSTDGQLDALISEARRMVPALRSAEVVERWAGLRPKAVGRDPMVGALPDAPGIWVLTGGFKVSFGLAHRLAEALIGAIAGGHGETGLPAGFAPERHLAEAGRPAGMPPA